MIDPGQRLYIRVIGRERSTCAQLLALPTATMPQLAYLRDKMRDDLDCGGRGSEPEMALARSLGVVNNYNNRIIVYSYNVLSSA